MEILEERNYVIYKHTSPNNGKCYIGLTNNYMKRCSQHKKPSGCRLFYRAVSKYGWDALTHEILEENLTLQEAKDREKHYIEYYNSLSPNGYNLNTGGEGFKVSKETKEKQQGLYKGSNTGISGIYKVGDSYRVEFKLDGEILRLGNYSNMEDAILAKTLRVKTSKANTPRESKLGVVGIRKRRNSYYVAIIVDGKTLDLGSYSNMEDAILAKTLRVKTSKALTRKENKLGIPGINKTGETYNVKIAVDGKRINLGNYWTIDEAKEAKLLCCRTEKAIERGKKGRKPITKESIENSENITIS